MHYGSSEEEASEKEVRAQDRRGEEDDGEEDGYCPSQDRSQEIVGEGAGAPAPAPAHPPTGPRLRKPRLSASPKTLKT
jgi:hypothetical protein